MTEGIPEKRAQKHFLMRDRVIEMNILNTEMPLILITGRVNEVNNKLFIFKKVLFARQKHLN